MADFKFVRALNGMTPQTELVTAGGAMEVGDIVVHSSGKVTKAADNPTKATLAGLCLGKHQEDGAAIADGDLVQVLPIGTDAILEGIQKTTASNPGTEVGIDLTGTDLSFEAAGNKVGQIFKVIDATARIVQVRMYSQG